jgi:cation transport regulator ChaC
MTEQVFAYGSNMCSGRLRKYNVVPEGLGRAASLQDYGLRFNKQSQKDSSGKANVEPCPGEEVWGVVYAIPNAHLKILDHGEGTGYGRKRMSVRMSSGEVTESWVYLARAPSKDPALRPYTWYMHYVVEGAREHSLPASYIETLERIAADQDADQGRDHAKRLLVCRV